MSQAKSRQAICFGCEQRTATFMGFMCKECRCNIRAKSNIPFAECPLGKWELEND
tara:strand:+ start:439 stop:603 length:165 start_codon:yes stop_codon:yes gene_type:complete